LDEEFKTAIEGLFFFRSEVAGGQLVALPVIMQAFAAQGVLAARGVRAGAVF
jgi:hypothetical protein